MDRDEFTQIISQIYPDFIICVEEKCHMKQIYFLHKNGKVESSFIVSCYEQIINHEIEHFTTINNIAERNLNILKKRKDNIAYINKDLIFKVQR